MACVSFLNRTLYLWVYLLHIYSLHSNENRVKHNHFIQTGNHLIRRWRMKLDSTQVHTDSWRSDSQLTRVWWTRTWEFPNQCYSIVFTFEDYKKKYILFCFVNLDCVNSCWVLNNNLLRNVIIYWVKGGWVHNYLSWESKNPGSRKIKEDGSKTPRR